MLGFLGDSFVSDSFVLDSFVLDSFVSDSFVSDSFVSDEDDGYGGDSNPTKGGSLLTLKSSGVFKLNSSEIGVSVSAFVFIFKCDDSDLEFVADLIRNYPEICLQIL